MNRYGQLALDHSRRFRPIAYSQIPDPTEFFTEAGEQIAAAVMHSRDEILGPARPGENPEDYRIRSYQAMAMAEEMTLQGHHLLQPETVEQTDGPEDDPVLDRRYQTLATINEAVNRPL